MDGTFKSEVTDFAGMHVKPADDHMKTDIEIIKWLAHNGKLFSKEKYEHSYPHCWRCDTPLINYATASWFVAVTKVKERALEEATKINWSPAHIKEGRFGKWLEGARDWSISRQRFWASCMPVWECTESENSEQGTCDYVVVGSVEELEKLSGQKIEDLHKHILDEVTFRCPTCSKTMTRIPDVLDTWFDSGSMPYAQLHYPFANEEKFEGGFPADFIAEGQDQTRAWFYYLHVLATALRGTPAFQNVIVNGIVLAEDGKKMSKKLKNYPDPNMMLEKYGADAMRYFMLTSPIVAAENLNFSETGVREVFNKVVNTLWNVLTFYKMFDDGKSSTEKVESNNVLDMWIRAKLQVLVKGITDNMESYQLNEATRPIMDFILDLSQWYVRRSRDRFKGDDDQDKQFAIATLREVLMTLSKVMAPFTPFIAEKVYQELGGDLESVHLEMWPVYSEKLIVNSEKVLNEMEIARKIVEMGLSLRAEAKVKVRQPLSKLQVVGYKLQKDLLTIIADEINVKDVVVFENIVADGYIVKEDGDLIVALDITLTDELRKEGLVRELTRAINQMRKQQGLTREDRIVVKYQTDDELLGQVFESYGDELKAAVLADELATADGMTFEVATEAQTTAQQSEEMQVDGRLLSLSVSKS